MICIVLDIISGSVATDSFPPRTLSITESDILTPTFNDSGIQLEFAISESDNSDTCSVESAGSSICSGPEKDVGHFSDSTDVEALQHGNVASAVDSMRLPSDQLITAPLPATIRRFTDSVTTITQEQDVHGPSRDSGAIEEAQSHATTLEQANMEGRLESLHAEYSSVLEERKVLQFQLRAVESKLKQELERAKKPSDPSGSADREDLEQKYIAIESELANVQRACQTRDDDLNDTRGKLHLSQLIVRNLKEKLSRLEDEMEAKEETVDTLNMKMESIQRSLSIALEKNKSLVQEKDVLTSDVTALISAKEWFQKQLAFAQEARTKLQLEISDYESTVANQNKVIEQLKCDSASTSRQLTTLQQTALEDKTRVLKHLEKVEEDMREHGLSFKQIQLDKQTMERTLKVKINALQKENEDLNKLACAAGNLEKGLRAARQEMEANQCLLDKIRQEKEELVTQLKTTQHTVEDHKSKLDVLKGQYEEVNRKLIAAKEKEQSSNAFIQGLKDEKRNLEDNLKSVKEERAAFDSAVVTLKVDLDRVERRFKLMKRELTKKTAQLEQISAQKDGFIQELRMLRDELDRQLGLSETLREDMRGKDKLVDELQKVKVQLEQEIFGLSEELKKSEVQRVEADMKTRTLQEKLKSADRLVL